MVKNLYEIGGLDRGRFRRSLKALSFYGEDLTFQEDKSFLNSVFYVRSDTRVMKYLDNLVDEFNKEGH